MSEFRLGLVRGNGARDARELIARALRTWDVEDPDASLLLVVTELVENVYQHTRGDGELRLALRTGTVLVEVSDTSADLPLDGHARADPSQGRGLALVRTLAATWGARPGSGGKVVWAELALTPDGHPGARRIASAPAAEDR
ncbi:MAG: magnesium or manganese-dependent protein phosphatase [Actinomycetia bacterium]|nr:magnesium or manganese-dependent protein phosphatase [Actinomycetes bacterium]